jgi:hypothetical protein
MERGVQNVSTIEDVRTAEKAMNDAQEALRAYTEQQPFAPDPSLRRYLVAELRTATENYEKAMRDLRSTSAPTVKKQV